MVNLQYLVTYGNSLYYIYTLPNYININVLLYIIYIHMLTPIDISTCITKYGMLSLTCEFNYFFVQGWNTSNLMDFWEDHYEWEL